MGAWGVSAFDNDSAADWFGDLWDEVPLPTKIGEMLEIEVDEDNHEEIRAAVHVLVQLGVVYIWPVGLIDPHCKLAIQRLKEIQSIEIFEDEEFQTQIQSEIDLLQGRISKKGQKR